MTTRYEAENPFNLVEVALTPKQQMEWTKVKAGLQWQAPGFAHILISMLNPRNNDAIVYWVKDRKTLSTDGVRIVANPDYFFSLTIYERIAALVHEVAHGMWDHCGALSLCRKRGYVDVNGKQLPYDKNVAGKAIDYVVNDMIFMAKIGKLNPSWLHDKNIGTQDDSWAEVYDRLFVPPPPCGGGSDKQQNEEGPEQDDEGGGGGDGDEGENEDDPGEGDGQSDEHNDQSQDGGVGEEGENHNDPHGNDLGGSGQDEHLEPGSLGSGDTPDKAQERREKLDDAWRNAIAVAEKMTMEALGRGTQTANQLKFFQQFLQPRVSWGDQIEGTFAKKLGSGSYDYRRPDRRLITRDIYAPGRSGHGCRTLVLASDTSGSIFAVPNLLERFFAEMAEIISVYNPRRTYVLWIDAAVKREVLIEDIYDLQAEWEHGAEGGGGTSFVPAFDWVEKQDIADDIDAMIYLTDLDGSFPSEAPNYPVIWVSIDHNKRAPFGDQINIPADGTA